MNTQLTQLGTFEMGSGLLLASDPCYVKESNHHPGMNLNRVFAADVGKWNAAIVTDGDWGVAQLVAWHWHHSLPDELRWDRVENGFGVDSGTFGFFDFDQIRRHGSIDIVYEALRNECGGVLPGGCASRSGHGDGLYGVDIRTGDFGLVTAIRCTFICEGDVE